MSRYTNNPKLKIARAEYNKKYYARTSTGRNRLHRWTLAEMRMVQKHEISDTELAKKIHRSVAAIQKMRWQLKSKTEYTKNTRDAITASLF
ncbi:hypothetical protein SAMN05216391_10866 [Lachnospiraceae bacterium KHCPX20]|nr:hypothetical protein SAMN05216391_10866 [Lachnospiraceae bacterium KHCPX20]